MYDLHLTCEWNQVFSLLDALKQQLQTRAEEVTLLDWGFTSKQVQGCIILEWNDEVDEAFLDDLRANAAVLDFSVYSVPCSTDDPFDEAALPERGWW